MPYGTRHHDSVCVPCRVGTRGRLLSIHHRTQLQASSRDENFQDLPFQQLSSLQHGRTACSLHAAQLTPGTHSATGGLCLLTPVTHFTDTHASLLQPQLKACTELAHRAFPAGSAGGESACNAGDLGWEDPPEKGKATHSSVRAWRIPWTA